MSFLWGCVGSSLRGGSIKNVWNTAARLRLNNHNLTWDLAPDTLNTFGAYTNGSCQAHQGKQVTGAGTCHPATSAPSFVEPKWYGHYKHHWQS